MVEAPQVNELDAAVALGGEPDLNPSMALGSGSIISTAHDLNRFHAAVYATSDGGPATQQAMSALVDQEPCRTHPLTSCSPFLPPH